MEPLSGTAVPGAAASAVETAVSTLLEGPTRQGVASHVRVRNRSVNGLEANSCTATVAWSAVMFSTRIPWMVTPAGIFGSCAKAGPTSASAAATAAMATAERIVGAILLIEQVGVIRDRAVGSCRENALEVGASLDRPGKDGCARRMAPIDDRG